MANSKRGVAALIQKMLTSAGSLVPGIATRTQVSRALHNRLYDTDELVAAYKSVPAVYTCVHLKAATVAQTPLRVYQRATGKGSPVSKGARKMLAMEQHGRKAREAAANDEELEEITDRNHPANALLTKWNDVYDDFSGMYMLATWLDLSGGVVLPKVYADGRQYPSELWVCQTNRLWVEPDAERGYPYIVGYRYGETNTDAEKLFTPDEVVRIGMPAIDQPFQFHSAYSSAIHEIRQLYRFTQFNTSLLENGGSPGGVYTGFKGDQKEMDRLRADFERKFSGTFNAGKLFITTGDGDYRELQVQKELSFLESAREAAAVVFKAAGVPMTLLEQENANLAGAARANPQFVAIAVNPMLRQIEDALNAQLAPDFGEDVFFGFDPVNAEESDVDASMAQWTGNAITLNEVRATLGFDPIDDPELGDSFFADMQPAQADPLAGMFNAIQPKRPEPEDDEEEEFEPIEIKALEPVKAAPRPLLWSDIAFGVKDFCGCECAEPPKGQRGTKDDRAADGVDGAREASLKLDSQLRSWFEKVYPQAIQIAESNTDPDTIARLVRGLFDGESASFREAVREPLMDMFSAGYREAGEGVDPDLGSFEVLSDEASRSFERRLQGLLSDVGETTGRQVAGVVQTAIDNGSTPKEAAAALREKVDDMSATRAERIARTEIGNALDDGRLNAWEESGVVEGKAFLLSSNPCDLCKAVAAKWAGKTAGIREPFVKSGETLGGVTFDRDIQNAKVHPQCRCGLDNVLTDR